MSEVERAARLKAESTTKAAKPPAEEKDKTSAGPPPEVSKGSTVGAALAPTATVGTAVRRGNGRFGAVGRAGRGAAAWAKRPSGRLIVPAVIAVVLLGAAGTAGAYLVPEALQSAPSPSATPGFPLDAAGGIPSAGQPGGLPDGTGQLPSASAPVGAETIAPTVAAQTQGRPADALAGWAGQIGTRVGIPVVAVQAYGYAELVTAKTMPSCHLSWTTIAAIASVESSHGSANGAVLSTDGMAMPPILGLPLDGKGGRQLIPDTDRGALDGDTTYDRAVGPLQFIPATWNSFKVDADNNGVADPNDIDDASLTAAKYLCQNGRDLSKPESWWDAILSYNAVRPYAQKVFDTANDYGKRSRT
ncbi:lytic murein transglycosylase [Actinoplanes bogorensis]|uniref:Lytic murein transglycosylase n=1 Tax=Paractinoplanes bogorensis TaxID=1610840 RepID=A0ABS5YI81_9ACTN|nr:lytic murein transglycosylase [Actinoplanes bogorensis]MBU2663052.1 lytic murein transglycosylase [Actinoplanes bogorensis]